MVEPLSFTDVIVTIKLFKSDDMEIVGAAGTVGATTDIELDAGPLPSAFTALTVMLCDKPSAFCGI